MKQGKYLLNSRYLRKVEYVKHAETGIHEGTHNIWVLFFIGPSILSPLSMDSFRMTLALDSFANRSVFLYHIVKNSLFTCFGYCVILKVSDLGVLLGLIFKGFNSSILGSNEQG
jgi:hypothetical protein